MAERLTGSQRCNDLRRILQQHGIDVDHPANTSREPTLQRLPRPEPQISNDDGRALEFLRRQRFADPEYKDKTRGLRGLVKSKKKKQRLRNPELEDFTETEKSQALEDLVKGSHDIVIIRRLLEDGADVDYIVESRSKKQVKQGLEPARFSSKCLSTAVTKRDPDLVSLLASYSKDDHRLSEPLKQAFELQDLNISEILLRANANPNVIAPETIVNVLMNGHYEMVRLLIRAPRPLAQSTCSMTLWRVIESGSHDRDVKLLLSGGAEPQENDSKALRKAIEMERVDLFLHMVHNRSIQAPHIEKLTRHVQTHGSTSTRIVFANIILCLHPPGKSAAELLVKATRDGDEELVRVLLDSGTSVNHKQAAALQHALKSDAMPMVRQFMSKPLNRSSLDAVANVIPLGNDKATTEEKISLLLSHGHDGPSLSKLILYSLANGLESSVESLLKAGFDVDYEHGAMLDAFISKQRFGDVDLLLQRSPSEATLSSCFQTALKVRPRATRSVIASKLLQAGAKGEPVSLALEKIVSEPTLDHELFDILLEGKADSNFNRGETLCILVKRGLYEMLNKITRCHTLTSISATRAFKVAISTQSQQVHRLEIIESLLRYQVDQMALDQALATEANTGHDLSVMRSLSRHHASINYDEGAAIISAIKTKQIKMLGVLLAAGTKPTQRVLGSALISAYSHEQSPERTEMVRHLLEAGAKGQAVDEGLDIATRSPADKALCELLLEHGASLDYSDGVALSNACVGRSVTICRLLLSRGSEPGEVAFNNSLMVLSELEDRDSQYSLYELILQAGARGPALDECLVRAIDHGVWSQKLVPLLVQYGASVEYNDGQALCNASRLGLKYVLSSLLAKDPPERIVSKAITAAMEIASRPGRRKVIKLLLESSPYCESIHRACAEAIAENDQELVNIFLCNHATPEMYRGGDAVAKVTSAGDHAFLAQMSSHLSARFRDHLLTILLDQAKLWSSEPHFSSAKILVAAGTVGSGAPNALIDAVRNLKAPFSQSMVDVLVSCSVDSDWKNGEALQIAVQGGHINLFQQLLTTDPSNSTLLAVFEMIMKASIEDEQICRMVTMTMKQLGQDGQDFLKTTEQLANPPIYLALRRSPAKPLVLGLLLRLGSNPNAGFAQWQQSIKPLHLLANLRPFGGLQEAIQLLVDAGADVNGKTNRSNDTPLTLAAKTNAIEFAKYLFRFKPDTLHTDFDSRSAMTSAAEKGHVEFCQLLLENKVPIEDENLHLATISAQSEVVSLFLERGADGSRPIQWSFMTIGLPALSALCKYGTEKLDRDHVIRVMGLLVRQNHHQFRSHGKSALIHAFEGADAYRMTKMLLKTPYYKTVNDEFNTFQDNNDLIYSPTRYIEKVLKVTDQNLKLDLLSLLRSYSCDDRFYALKGPQPPECVGLPPKLAAIEEQRKAEEERQAREQQARELRIERQRQDVELQIELEDQALQRRLLRTREEEANLSRQAEDRHCQQLLHEEQIQQSRQRLLDQEHRQQAVRAQELSDMRQREESQKLQYAREHQKLRDHQIQKEEASDMRRLKAQKSLIDAQRRTSEAIMSAESSKQRTIQLEQQRIQHMQQIQSGAGQRAIDFSYAPD